MATRPRTNTLSDAAVADFREMRRQVLGIGTGNVVNPFPHSSGHRAGRWFPGVIVDAGPEGESDFDDARYWVAQARPTNTDGDSNSLGEFGPFPEEHPMRRICCATNLNERLDNTHNTPIGTPVIVHYAWDKSTPPKPRFHFTAGSVSSGGAKRMRVTAVDLTGPRVVLTCNEYWHAYNIDYVPQVTNTKVWAMQGHAIGDVIYAVPIINPNSSVTTAEYYDGDVIWVEMVSLPTIGQPGMLLQVIGGDNRLGLDFLRAT